ncbi:hypothetical protein PF010_g5993 [Phytophthora fragariae]|uniref:SWIM-type domain-containing protein n=1 Tax=Phytophthora fragariae TaxID=53985 RepID=A0A6A3LTY8_9STRA|nr:hypothetical protein PF011_g4823 [Phytophthora fragariae]KAE9124489.1 hypothetical protein PF010_g5993 [Phytophthora fragariae]KAE9254306.1 hypothetical protein PF004_g1092 [Phytophthora fragariae]
MSTAICLSTLRLRAFSSTCQCTSGGKCCSKPTRTLVRMTFAFHGHTCCWS